MKLITHPKAIIRRELKQLTLLMHTYRAVVQSAPAWHQQIIKDVTQSVLDSDEIRNAMSYATKIKANDVLTRTIEQSGELLRLENSPMTELTIYGRGSYSVLKENILHTLREHHERTPETVAPSPGTPQSSPRVSRADSGDITLKDIGAALGNLAASLVEAFVVLGLGLIFLLAAMNIIVGITLGGNSALLADALFILTGAILVYLATQSCVRWTLSEKEVNALKRTVIAPFVREQVNVELRRANLEDSFHIMIAPGLIELSDRQQIVETVTMRRLRTLLNTMTYGSIGVSGTRGTGKSVLLKAFCDERFGRPQVPELGILVSAPVDYDGRDFILHLFSTVCHRVINLTGTSRRVSRLSQITVSLYQIGVIVGGCLIAAEAGVKLSREQIGFGERLLLGSIVATIILAILTRFTGVRFTGVRFTIGAQQQALGADGSRPVTSASKRGKRIAFLITIAAFIIMMIGAVIFVNSKIYISPHSVINGLPKAERFWPGVTILAAALIVAIANLLITRMPRMQHPRDIADQAGEYLRRIESIRTVTTGQSAMVGLPSRIQLNRSYANQLTERDLTLPAIVDHYRDFITNVIVWWRARHGGQGRMVIGIDELDKIANTESAERFL